MPPKLITTKPIPVNFTEKKVVDEFNRVFKEIKALYRQTWHGNNRGGPNAFKKLGDNVKIVIFFIEIFMDLLSLEEEDLKNLDIPKLLKDPPFLNPKAISKIHQKILNCPKERVYFQGAHKKVLTYFLYYSQAEGNSWTEEQKKELDEEIATSKSLIESLKSKNPKTNGKVYPVEENTSHEKSENSGAKSNKRKREDSETEDHAYNRNKIAKASGKEAELVPINKNFLTSTDSPTSILKISDFNQHFFYHPYINADMQALMQPEAIQEKLSLEDDVEQSLLPYEEMIL